MQKVRMITGNIGSKLQEIQATRFMPLCIIKQHFYKGDQRAEKHIRDKKFAGGTKEMTVLS